MFVMKAESRTPLAALTASIALVKRMLTAANSPLMSSVSWLASSVKTPFSESMIAAVSRLAEASWTWLEVSWRWRRRVEGT